MEGKQYIAFLAGGNSLAGSPRENQNVWLFALDGTVGPAKAPGGEQGAITHAGEADEGEQSEQTDENTVDRTTNDDNGADETGGGQDAGGGATAEVKGDPDAGKQVFSDNCSTCHGADGLGGNGGPDLTQVSAAGDLKAVTRQVTDGGGGMPAFKGQLNDQQIADVSAYVVQVIEGGG
jgi:cytochrome c553